MLDAAVGRFQPQVVVSNETDAEIDTKLRERFSVLGDLAEAAIAGDIRAMIVSGPAGLGKSFTIEQALNASDTPNCIVKGFVRATGLYKKLWQYRHAGNVLVFDDADSIFFDDVSLNLLKAACDSTDVRRVSYLAESQMEDEDGGTIPRSFAFDGTVIFITNFDMDEAIERGHRLEDHPVLFEDLLPPRLREELVGELAHHRAEGLVVGARRLGCEGHREGSHAGPIEEHVAPVDEDVRRAVEGLEGVHRGVDGDRHGALHGVVRDEVLGEPFEGVSVAHGECWDPCA
jgi:hypothetical protein